MFGHEIVFRRLHKLLIMKEKDFRLMNTPTAVVRKPPITMAKKREGKTYIKHLHPDGLYRGCKPGGPKCKCSAFSFVEMIMADYK